jgi:DNA-directed RNA polymerase subunit RPC12/RpoP
MIPLFDSESFAFIGSGDGELIVNCRKCRREAEAQIDAIKITLYATCRFCETRAEFKFRPSVRIAPHLPNRGQSLAAGVGLEGDSLLASGELRL